VVTASPRGSIGVLDMDGLRLVDRPLVPIRGAIRHVGDLYNGARRHGLTQLWLTDAWVRAAGLPDRMRQVSESVVVKSQSAGYPSSFTAAH